MKLTALLTTGAAAALIAGAAIAQTPAQTSAANPLDVTAPAVDQADGDVTKGDDITTDNSLTAETSAAGETPVTAPVAASATTYAQGASVTTMTVTNGPVPDTAENRAKYGQPLSRTGRMTSARGN